MSVNDTHIYRESVNCLMAGWSLLQSYLVGFREEKHTNKRKVVECGRKALGVVLPHFIFRCLAPKFMPNRGFSGK